MNNKLGLCFAACAAGAVTGVLGAGGGMILLPLLSFMYPDQDNFSISLALMLPICAASLFFRLRYTVVPWSDASIYMIGSITGGFGAGIFGKKIPRVWLHRFFGCLVLIGGVRFLWS